MKIIYKTKHDCKDCSNDLCAKTVPIFTSLSHDEMSQVVSLITRKHYDKGEIIIREGEKLEKLVLISKGQAKAYRYTTDGKEQILYIFNEGEFFGEKNLFKNSNITYNVETLEETHLCMIDKANFQVLLKEYPSIGLKIMEELCNRIEKLENVIENIGTKRVEARVSSVLLEFGEKYGKKHSKGIVFDLPLSREGIANYIGLTRETVSRKMNHLQEEGIIEMIGNKKVIILNKMALEESVQQ